LGYISRVGTQAVQVWLGPRKYEPAGLFRRRFLDVNAKLSWNYDRIVYQKELGVDSYLELKNYWWVSGGVMRRLQVLDDLDTRGGPVIKRPASTSIWFEVDSDKRKSFNEEFYFEWERNKAGSTWRSVNLLVAARPSTRIEFSFRPRYTWKEDDAQWVTNIDDNGDNIQDHFVYGELKSRVFEVTTRCSWVFTRDLTLQLYMQPFVAVGDYENFKELARPRSYEFTSYEGLTFNPDFRRRSLRSNLVLRWEYRPGSTLFVVWSQSREASSEEPELRPWTNLRKSYTDEGANIFLVKLNYWMNI
jgi:hypothetical protein